MCLQVITVFFSTNINTCISQWTTFRATCFSFDFSFYFSGFLFLVFNTFQSLHFLVYRRLEVRCMHLYDVKSHRRAAAAAAAAADDDDDDDDVDQ